MDVWSLDKWQRGWVRWLVCVVGRWQNLSIPKSVNFSFRHIEIITNFTQNLLITNILHKFLNGIWFHENISGVCAPEFRCWFT